MSDADEFGRLAAEYAAASADVPGGRVTATVSRHSFRPGFRFDVAVEPAAAPAGVAVTDDDGSTD
jgi:hypothetical protein